MINTIQVPSCVGVVRLTAQKVEAICPVDGEADNYMVEVWVAGKVVPEAISFGEFLDDLACMRLYCEEVAEAILRAVVGAVGSTDVKVEVTQVPRHRVAVFAEASL